MVEISVEYPAVDDDVQIPDEFLQTAVREFRKNLEYAVSIENELGGYRLDLLARLNRIQTWREAHLNEHSIYHGVFCSMLIC